MVRITSILTKYFTICIGHCTLKMIFEKLVFLILNVKYLIKITHYNKLLYSYIFLVLANLKWKKKQIIE